MIATLAVANVLSRDCIYEMCRLGWQDMEMKWQGVTQVKNMLTTQNPNWDLEGGMVDQNGNEIDIAQVEAGDAEMDEWPRVPPPCTMYFNPSEGIDEKSDATFVNANNGEKNIGQN